MPKLPESKERQGELYIFFEVLLWALFPVITVLSFNKISPLVSLGWSTLFATFFFGIVVIVKRKLNELQDRTAMKDVFFASLLLSVGFYCFYFVALRYTSPGNASIIALSEVFFSYLFFHVFKKESIPHKHVLGAVLMVIGATIVLLPNFQSFNIGDILVLIGVSTAPLGNFFQRRARSRISSDSILFVRSFIGTVVVFLLTIALEGTENIGNIQASLPFLLINGILILGLSKILWLEGIHRISVTKAIALSSSSPLLTLFFAWIFLNNIPTIWQLGAFLPMFVGVILLSTKTN